MAKYDVGIIIQYTDEVHKVGRKGSVHVHSPVSYLTGHEVFAMFTL